MKQISSNYGCYHCYCYDSIYFLISKNNECFLSFTDSSYKLLIFYDVNNGDEMKKFNNEHDNGIYTIKIILMVNMILFYQLHIIMILKYGIIMKI